MTCSGCAQRREAIKSASRYVYDRVKMILDGRPFEARATFGAPPVVRPSGENAGRKAVNPRQKNNAR